MGAVKKQQLKSLVGKHVFVLTRQGQMIDGILQEVGKDKIFLRQHQSKHNMAHTTAFFGFNPIGSLALFDLLAIGAAPFAFGAFPFFI